MFQQPTSEYCSENQSAQLSTNAIYQRFFAEHDDKLPVCGPGGLFYTLKRCKSKTRRVFQSLATQGIVVFDFTLDIPNTTVTLLLFPSQGTAKNSAFLTALTQLIKLPDPYSSIPEPVHPTIAASQDSTIAAHRDEWLSFIDDQELLQAREMGRKMHCKEIVDEVDLKSFAIDTDADAMKFLGSFASEIQTNESRCLKTIIEEPERPDPRIAPSYRPGCLAKYLYKASASILHIHGPHVDAVYTLKQCQSKGKRVIQQNRRNRVDTFELCFDFSKFAKYAACSLTVKDGFVPKDALVVEKTIHAVLLYELHTILKMKKQVHREQYLFEHPSAKRFHQAQQTETLENF